MVQTIRIRVEFICFCIFRLAASRVRLGQTPVSVLNVFGALLTHPTLANIEFDVLVVKPLTPNPSYIPVVEELLPLLFVILCSKMLQNS